VPPINQPGARSLFRVPWAEAGLLTLTAILVFLVALGSSRSLARVPATHNLLNIRPVLGDFFVVILGFLFVVFCLLVYLLFANVRRRRSEDLTEAPMDPAVPEPNAGPMGSEPFAWSKGSHCRGGRPVLPRLRFSGWP
jgi:hypothetical protein